MAIAAMMATAAMGMGLFAPPAMIGGIILGPEAAIAQTPGVIMAGLVLHMGVSMIFGAIFVLIAPAIQASYLLLGAVYGLILWIVNFYGLSYISAGARAMVTHEPVMLAIVTHLIFGLVLAALVARSASSALRPTV